MRVLQIQHIYKGVFFSQIRMRGAGFINDDGQVLTRGPVHEAFADLTQSADLPDEVISRSPPDPIEELPPDQKPEGDNVTWIPGYWSWDGERGDFIWISGVWRDLPPNRQWVPGYWTDVRGGHQFIAGFWQEVGHDDVEYFPQPPQPLDVGPSSPSPGANYTWARGSWRWSNRS